MTGGAPEEPSGAELPCDSRCGTHLGVKVHWSSCPHSGGSSGPPTAQQLHDELQDRELLLREALDTPELWQTGGGDTDDLHDRIEAALPPASPAAAPGGAPERPTWPTAAATPTGYVRWVHGQSVPEGVVIQDCPAATDARSHTPHGPTDGPAWCLGYDLAPAGAAPEEPSGGCTDDENPYRPFTDATYDAPPTAPQPSEPPSGGEG